MPTSRVWPSGIVNVTPLTYQIPLSGEINWSNLTDFLVALADGAQSTTFQKFAVRVAVTSPVTLVSPEDCVVATDLTVPGPVTVNLPAGSAKQIFFIIDGKGDASTNNVTIIPDGTDTIRGATSLVLANDRAAVMLAFNAADTDWKVIGPTILPGTISLADIVPVPADANMALVRDALGFVIDAFIADVNVSATAAIARSKLGLGTPDQVVINSPTGAFSSEAALAASRGGLGTNASAFTGVVHANAGVFTASPVVDADVAANAAINATKIADGSVDNTEFQRLGTAGTNGAGNLVTTDGVQTLTNKTLGSTNNITGATASSLTNAGTVAIPPGTDTLVNLNSVQTLTNKTIDGASNTITNVSLTTGVTGILPIANGGTNAATANAALNNLLPAQAGNVGRVLGTDGTNTSWTTAGGGSGGINLVNSPSTADGWTETGTVFATPVTTTTAGDLPLTPEVTTAIQFVASGSGPETTDYNSYSFTVPPALGVKLGISLYLRPGTGFVSGQWTLSIYTAGGVRQSLSTDSGGVTLIPAVTGQFVSTFDAVAGTSYTIRIARTSGAGAATLNVAEVNVGTAAIVQGAAVSTSFPWTPTITASGGGTVSVGNGTANALWSQNGSRMKCNITWAFGTTGTSFGTSGYYRFGLPTGYTVNTGYYATTKAIGSGYYRDSDLVDNWVLAVTVDSTPEITCSIAQTATANQLGTTQPVTLANGDFIQIEFEVEIAEWAGSGTVNLAQNGVSFTSDDGSADVFGPAGALVPNVASSTGATLRAFTPPGGKSDTDLYHLELNYQGQGWSDAAALFPPSGGNNGSSNNIYGAQGLWTSATVYTVIFGNQGTAVAASNVSAGANSWASENAVGTRFRLRKSSGGQAVGFGEVVPGVSSGLVSASGLKGNPGTTVPTGYVGEVKSGTGSFINGAASPTAIANTGALSGGIWAISASVNYYNTNATGVAALRLYVATAANSSAGTTDGLTQINSFYTGGSVDSHFLTSPVIYVVVAAGATPTYWANTAVSFTGGPPRWSGSIQAVRIA